MLILLIAVVAVLIIIGGFVFSMLITQSSQGQLKNHSENIALKTALLINKGDRIGQMNNLVSASREMVFEDGQTSALFQRRFPQLTSLSAQLFEESVAGATLVAEENKTLTKTAVNDLRQVMRDINSGKTKLDSVPFSDAQTARVVTFNGGTLSSETDSNVIAPSGNPQLLEHDLTCGYINKKTMRYYGNKTLTLPKELSDLEFQLSTVPISKGNQQPAGLVTAAVFRPLLTMGEKGKEIEQACKYVPCALQLELAIDVVESTGGKTKVNVTSYASTSGANQAPWEFHN